MESVVLGIILAVVTYLTLLPHVGMLFAVILAVVVFVLESGAVTYVTNRRSS